MPTYEYACKDCGEHLEVVQSFSDDALTVCPNCSGPLRKVFGNIGVSFKGSGFYKTDSRNASKPAAAKTESAPAAETKTETPKTETKTETPKKETPKSSDTKAS